MKELVAKKMALSRARKQSGRLLFGRFAPVKREAVAQLKAVLELS